MWRILSIVVLSACNPFQGGVESEFSLAADSRLPKWLSLPSGYSRADVEVKLTYYTPGGSEDAAIEMTGRFGSRLLRIVGTSCWHPTMETKRNQYGGFDPGSEPHFTYFVAHDQLEVIEHPGGPVFRISDDLALVKAALSAPACNHG